MKADAFKQAEAVGYSKGYAAGKRREQTLALGERRRAQENEFWSRAMLAALPFAMQQSTWSRGEKTINTLAERMKFAAEIADAALKEADGGCRI